MRERKVRRTRAKKLHRKHVFPHATGNRPLARGAEGSDRQLGLIDDGRETDSNGDKKCQKSRRSMLPFAYGRRQARCVTDSVSPALPIGSCQGIFKEESAWPALQATHVRHRGPSVRLNIPNLTSKRLQKRSSACSQRVTNPLCPEPHPSGTRSDDSTCGVCYASVSFQLGPIPRQNSDPAAADAARANALHGLRTTLEGPSPPWTALNDEVVNERPNHWRHARAG